MKHSKTVLDIAFDEKQKSINTNFLKEWKPFEELSKMVERAILRHFMKHTYKIQPTHDENSQRDFKPSTFSQIDNVCGFAYTSSGAYAGYWVCNGGYLWADDTHRFIGFTINELNEVICIADDDEENSIYIKL
jgi:hypothetical protein